MDELMTIGAFAARTGLSVSALRFYASQQLLLPAEVDSANGYRRYAEAQVVDGMLIRDLRRLDMPLDDIALALERSEPERKELVERQLRRLEEVVARAHGLARTMGIINPTENTTMSAAMTAALSTDDLIGALDQVLSAAGTDPELPHLMGVLVEGKAGSLRLVATDSYRLAVRDLVPSHLNSEFTAVVPAATLVAWRTSLNGPGELTLSVDGNRLEVTSAGQELAASVLPVTFPDYEKFLVPRPEATTVRVARQTLTAVLDGIDDETTLEISTAENSLRVGDGPRSTDVEARCEGAEQRVALNTRFARDAVRGAVGAEVIIEIENSLSPVLFRSADDGTFTSRVMPIELE